MAPGTASPAESSRLTATFGRIRGAREIIRRIRDRRDQRTRSYQGGLTLPAALGHTASAVTMFDPETTRLTLTICRASVGAEIEMNVAAGISAGRQFSEVHVDGYRGGRGRGGAAGRAPALSQVPPVGVETADVTV